MSIPTHTHKIYFLIIDSYLMNNLKNFKRIETNKFINARIFDNRLESAPNNKMVLTCEHASRLLPEGRVWSAHDQKYFENTHWGSDLGAQDMAIELSKELECALVVSKYSRLFCDVNRVVCSETLCRLEGDGQKVELNEDMTEEEEDSRLTHFESYLRALRMLQQKIDPEVVISVHSFTDLYEGQKRDIEVGVLFSHDSCENMAKYFMGEFTKANYNSGLNVPWNGKE